MAEHTPIGTLNAALQKVGNYQIGAQILSANDVNTENKPNSNAVTTLENRPSFISTYKPLLLVFAYILLVTLLVEFSHDAFQLHRFMPNFMTGFFLVFSFFKLLDLQGFAKSYAMYDLGAKYFPAYAYIYPFIELGLGAAYILAPRAPALNWFAFIIMTFSAIGVILAVANKQKIRCACLGTGFNLPMTTVTIVEDCLMAAMAAWMLI